MKILNEDYANLTVHLINLCSFLYDFERFDVIVILIAYFDHHS